MIRITAPEGKKLRDLRTQKLHTEVICDEKHQNRYVIADSDDDPIIEQLESGATLVERVSDLEDAVIELAEIISEVE